ncbi:MAG: metallopeptidase [Nanoarchaeota archaeon]|nr:metallopeptidase [Nanoarchaeota archaeon]
MAIKYELSPEIESKVKDIVKKLNMNHIDLNRIICVKSRGSKAKRTIARCHALSKIWQKALGIKGHYVIEVISENFDNLPPHEKEKVIIHELLHVPFSMGGGFKHHKNYVTRRRVEKLHREYKSKGEMLE